MRGPLEVCGGSAGLGTYTGTINDDGVAAFAKPTQERLGQGGVAEEVLPGGVWQIRTDYMELNAAACVLGRFLNQLPKVAGVVERAE